MERGPNARIRGLCRVRKGLCERIRSDKLWEYQYRERYVRSLEGKRKK